MTTETYNLSPDWQEWITTNVERGCDKTEVLTLAIKGGVDPKAAFNEVYGSGVTRYRSKTWTNIQSNKIQLSDREVDVIFQSTDPEIIVFGNVLSDEECDRLIALSEEKVSRSKVVDFDTGDSVMSQARTSAGCWFHRAETDLHATIEARISELTRVPVDHGEGLQVLHYQPGQEFQPHVDYFVGEKSIDAHCSKAGQRIGTFLIYLSDVEAGGQTAFPKLNMSTAPRKGHGLFFSYMNEDGELDERSYHAGSPVTAGNKWICTKWLRERPYV